MYALPPKKKSIFQNDSSLSLRLAGHDQSSLASILTFTSKRVTVTSLTQYHISLSQPIKLKGAPVSLRCTSRSKSPQHI